MMKYVEHSPKALESFMQYLHTIVEEFDGKVSPGRVLGPSCSMKIRDAIEDIARDFSDKYPP